MAKINTLNYQTVASWNGSQDLFVVEQPDGTKVATPAMVKQYVLNDMDEVPTQDSNDPVKSGGVFNTVDNVYSVMGQMGAKNLLVPKWVETQTTENGVTYTFNDDGTIIMNTDASGATANTNCNLRQNTVTTNNVFPAGTYTLTACPAGGSSTTYRTWARAYRPNTTTALTSNLYDEGNGVSFTVSEPFSLGLNVTVMNGYVCNNLTWKPMLRYASDTDNTYQPYAKTNRQLTEVIGDLSQTGLTGDSVAEQLGGVSGQIAGINTALSTKLSLFESVSTDTGDSVTFTKQLELDKNYLVVMSAATTYTDRRARMSLIVFGNNNTINEVYTGDSFTITNNNRILTISSEGIRYGITASILKL